MNTGDFMYKQAKVLKSSNKKGNSDTRSRKKEHS